MNWQLITTMVLVMFLQSCSKTVTNTYWVGGEKKKCVGANAERDCLQILKSDNIDEGEWQLFYSNIEGFEFEPGYMQKIVVKEEKLDQENMPADVSNIKYTQVKALEKIIDYRTELSGDWLLATIEGGPINRMVIVPTMNINFNNNKISGNGGCNQFFGDIESWTDSKVVLSPIGATRKLCNTKNMETRFFKTLDKVSKYELTQKGLRLLDKDEKEILFFIKQNNEMDNMKVDYREELAGNWLLATMKSNPINRMIVLPNLSIDFNEMRVYGNGGCNDFNGEIESWTDSNVSLGGIATTTKLCTNKNIEAAFLENFNQVSKYKLNNKGLIFMNDKGEELLFFIKQNVGAKMPKSIDGSFGGEIPCADCDYIRQLITFSGNSSFEMESISFKGKSAIQKDRKGTYSVKGDIITLIDNDWKQSYKFNGKSLLMLDKNGMEIDSDLNYRLDKLEAMP